MFFKIFNPKQKTKCAIIVHRCKTLLLIHRHGFLPWPSQWQSSQVQTRCRQQNVQHRHDPISRIPDIQTYHIRKLDFCPSPKFWDWSYQTCQHAGRHHKRYQFFKNGPTPAPFCYYFQSFQSNTKLMWKMSIQNPAPGFELTTFWLWVFSLNQ